MEKWAQRERQEKWVPGTPLGADFEDCLGMARMLAEVARERQPSNVTTAVMTKQTERGRTEFERNGASVTLRDRYRHQPTCLAAYPGPAYPPVLTAQVLERIVYNEHTIYLFSSLAIITLIPVTSFEIPL